MGYIKMSNVLSETANLGKNVLSETTHLGADVIEDTLEIADTTCNTAKEIGKNTVSSFSNIIEKYLKPEELFKNPILYGVIAIFLTMYGPRLQPKLPESIRNLFNNNYFRFLVIVLIAFLSSKNLQLSLI